MSRVTRRALVRAALGGPIISAFAVAAAGSATAAPTPVSVPARRGVPRDKRLLHRGAADHSAE